MSATAPHAKIQSGTKGYRALHSGEEVLRKKQIRVTFMGSSPLPRPGGTSVYVELGNGENFIFDMGPGSIANYLAARVPLNRLNDIFLTHLACG